MKYEQQTDLESLWKWEYLIKKQKDNIKLTDLSEKEELDLISLLRSFENQADMIEMWIADYLSITLINTLKQSIRARRKRFFNSKQTNTRKKSIDLNYQVWERLSLFSKKESWTLSESIDYLIDHYTDTINNNEQIELTTELTNEQDNKEPLLNEIQDELAQLLMDIELETDHSK